MQLQIFSLEGVLFEGKTDQVSLPTVDGEITVLENHIPLITLLKKGVIKTKEKNVEIPGGFVEVGGDKVVVLAN